VSYTGLTVAEATERIRRGTLSPVALVEAYLSRIDALDGRLQAWVTVDREGALSAARERDREATRGAIRGPLHGIPVGVKDIFYVGGMRCTAGSKVTADFVAPFDATCVARLRQAGAIILGKTQTTEFATFDPAPTHNPWKLGHTPGGSSSGSAAAVAARMAPCALGTQTAGSILRPASFCGVVGYKPSYGRVSRYGVFPVSWALDHIGSMARTVEDAALVAMAMAGHDPKDPGSLRAPVPDLRACLARRDPPRLGVVRDFFWEKAAPEVARHTDQALERLTKAGARIEERRLAPTFAVAHAAHRIVMKAEMAEVHRDRHKASAEKFGPRIRAGIEAGMLIGAADYFHALRLRRQFAEDLWALAATADALVTPSTPTPAPEGLGSTGDPMFQTPWTFAGMPAVTVPSGLTEGGLPLGLQIVAAQMRDAEALGVAAWCERILGPLPNPPL
jgi:aspartyl-tRNA(Asn)/glutamyl-tRNA(Gln) amidotransferase subunit A